MKLKPASIPMKTIKQITKIVHANAKRKGFHDQPKMSVLDQFIDSQTNNLHDEVSELHEAWRKGKFFDLCDKDIPLNCCEEEYADIIIRVLDQCARLGIDIQRAIEIKHAYNKTRPHRHGGKLS